MSNSITIAPESLSIADTQFYKQYSFKSGHKVPIFDVMSMHGLNQIIGHLKFNNRDYGHVYYRGQCQLFDKLLPSLFRGCKRTQIAKELNRIINNIIHDEYLPKELKLDATNEISKHKIEGILQHYGLPTRFIDLVDNHWVALWMGNNKYEVKKQALNRYCHFVQREVFFEDYASGEEKSIPLKDSDLFQYILLIALPYPTKNCDGVFTSSEHILVDLRQALPSVFLRPHAQHGLVARNKPSTESNVDDYDMSANIVCILRLRIDRVTRWLGNGLMLTQNNLFPPAGNDYGYDLLLSRANDFFNKEKFQIARYY